MRCAKCQANLGQLSKAGEPMVRARGFVLKAEGVTAICPKCGGDVPVVGEMAKAMGARLVLVFKGPR